MSAIKERYPGAGSIIVWSSTMSRMSRIERLIAALQDTHWGKREQTVQALRPFATDAIAPLLDALKHENAEMRIGAIHALVKFGTLQAVEPLIAIFTDRTEDPMVRKDAIWGIGKLGATQAIEPLIEVLTDDVGVVVVSAAHVLSRFGDVRAIHPLINALADMHKHWTVRKHIVEALGDFS
jgi:HEAT repeat protein